MNAPIPPTDPERLDELVSAYIDGVAAPEEIALIEASDDLMARVESMRSVSASLGAPVTPPPAAVRENHLAAAMGEFDRLFGAEVADTDGELATVTSLPSEPAARPEPVAAAASAPAPAATEPGVTSLAEARERKRPRRLNMVAAAAAVVALLFAGVVAVGLNTGGETTDVVDAASDAASAAIESSDQMVLPESTDDAGIVPAPSPAAARAFDDTAMDAEEEAMADEEAAMEELMVEEDAMAEDAMDAEEAFAAPATDAMDDDAMDDAADDAGDAGATQSQPIGFLGAFDSVDDLAAAATMDLNAEPATKAADDRSAFLAPTDCAEVAQALTGLGTPSLLSTAFLGGEPVELHATADDQIILLSSLDCAAIETIPGS